MEQQGDDDGGISTPLRVVLDTSVLYPPYLRDILLLAAETGLYQPIWSGLILAELRRNVLAQGIWPARIERTLAMMNWKFPRAERLVPNTLIEQMTNAPADRHVAALAVSAIARNGVILQSPDLFLVGLWDTNPERIMRIVAEQAAGYRKPAMSIDDLLDRLAVHAPSLVQLLRER